LIRTYTILTLLGCLCSVIPSFAQDKDNSIPLDHFYVDRKGPGIRKLLSKFTIGLSTGYGATTFKNKVEGYGIYQPAVGQPVVFNPDQPAVGFTNWFNRVDTTDLAINPADFAVNSDTAKIGFKSKSFNIPIKVTIHYEFLKRYRIGLGYSFEFTKVRAFEPLSYGKQLNTFTPEVSSFMLQKYFVMLGGSVYRYENYLLTIDANIGGYGLGKKFDKPNIKRGVFFNLGATVEREMSEYFKIFIRPSYEFKSFRLASLAGSPEFKNSMNAFYVNIGVSYRLPELRKCFHKQCSIQINHAHGNREYRSRVHPIYKKQNPHYGENHPELNKYKGKNKRKLNPY
jgi:hypothetical protein